MNSYLRQSTASQSRAVGPFVDDTDFKTAETALTIANTDIKLVVNGAASANKNSGGGTHRVNGLYGVTFDATDTATVGEMMVSVVAAGALPVFHAFTILEEAVYDAMFAASAPGYVANAPVSVAQFGGSNGTFSGGRPEVNLTHWLGTAAATPTTAGVPEVDVTFVNGSAALAEDPQLLLTTTIATLASQTSFTLTAGSADNSAYADCVIVVRDASTAVQKAVGWVDAYTGSTRTVTLEADPGVFTMAVGDSVDILPPTSLSKKRVAQGVHNAARSGYTVAGSFGQGVASVQGNVVGNVNALANDAITSGSFLPGAITGTALNASALAAIVTAVLDELLSGHATAGTVGKALSSTLTVADKLDTAMELDGSVYRFTVNALEQAPAGGGGGSTDWTADERTAIRSIMGIPASGTTPADPTAGILDTIRDAVGGVQSDTDNIQTRIPAALVSGRMNANVEALASVAVTEDHANGLLALGQQYTNTSVVPATVVNMNGNTITAGVIADGALNTANFGDGAITAAKFAPGAITSAVIAAGALTTATFAAGTTIPRVTLADTVTNLTNAPTAGDLTTAMTASVTAAVPTAAQTADKLIGRRIGGGADGGRTVGQALAASRNKVTRSGSTLTVYDIDDTTVLWTATLTSDAAADPLTGIDPT